METRNHRWPGRDEAKARWGHTEEWEQSREQVVRMYVDDARFGRLYRGKANYLLELVEAQASKECLDLDSLTWN